MTTAAGRSALQLPGALSLRLAPARAWWAALPARERRLAGLAAAVLALFVLWTLAIQPAWRAVRDTPAQLEALDLQLQAMQAQAAEARELRAAAPVSAAQSALALKAASDRLGDKARLALQGDRAVLTLTGVGSEALRNWLAETRAGARARTVEAQLARGPQGFSGTLTVTLVGTP